MRFRSLLLGLFLTVSLFTYSQGPKLSDQSEIVIMTLGPYQPELWSAFGHSAIRVIDPANRIDWIYNYGVFDFNQSNFYLNFAKGKTIYELGMAYYEPFRDSYIAQDRAIKEQYLNLTTDEKQQVFDFLQNNYLPENKKYLYNYVYDNCASKIPDVLNSVFGKQISYNDDFREEGKTVRNLMHDYLDYQPWGTWLIDIGLGMQIDGPANDKEYMFLPDYVAMSLEGATILGDQKRNLVKRTEIVNTPKNAPEENGILTPFNFFILLFFVVGFLTHMNLKKQKRSRWIDGILFGFSGMVGFWLVFLWAGTAHLSTWNHDLLWAIPFHLPMVIMMRFGKWQKLAKTYFKITAIWYALLLLVWAILPEPIHMALVPFTLLLLLRSLYISWDLKKVK